MFQSSRRFIAVTTRGSTATERLLRVKANSVVCVPVNGEFGALPGRTVGPGWAWARTSLSSGTSARAASWRWATVAPMTI